MRKLSKEGKDKIICLGCGWTGDIAELTEHGACPDCGCENGASPFRLLTLGEMLEDDEESGHTNVRLDLFLGTLFRLAGVDTNLQ